MKLIITIALIFNITESLYTQDGWIWQNPLPQGNFISNLQFVNSTTAYAMCYNSVMKSTNAGINWSIFYTQQAQNNASMHFVNENTGYIVCDTGIVIKTINGGINWNVVYNFNDKKFHKIYFIDVNTGFTLKFNEHTGQLGTSVFRTTNGGASWNILINDSAFVLRGIDFPNTQTGFIAGYSNTPHPNTFLSKFFRSTNSGISWDSISNPMYTKFYDCKFTDANTGFAYGERVFTTYKSLYKTTNGGTNWIPSDLTLDVRDVEQITGTSFLANTEFESLYKSTNNGLNWFLFNNSFSTLSFDFLNEFNGLAVGGNGDIKTTTNSGLNWNNQTINNNSDWIWGVDFVNENTGYATDDFHLLKTTNGGTNWNIVFTHGMYHLDFIDANTGYFGGEDSLFKTTDGGTTISPVHYSNTPGVLNEIQFLNANTGFIMGKYNITWKTTNGGDNWNILSGYGSGYHECLYFYNENLGFIGREDYNLGWGVSRTTNGGLNWDFQPFTDYFLLDFYFTSNTTGYFTTRNRIFKTTNAGNNWSITYDYNNIYYPIDIYAIQFANNNIGYAAITNGKLLKTTDSGNSWKIHNSITDHGFYDLYFTDVNTGYFVGSGGVILKTTNGGGSPIGIEPISSSIPDDYMLYQNYPNPFNPTTKIKFSIPAGINGKNGLTSLKIYDILGRELENPVNEILSAGEYEIEWNAENFPSGIYFYTLKNENFTKTGKMVLIK